MTAAYLPLGPAGHGVSPDTVPVLDPVTCWSWRACGCGCGEEIPPRNLAGYESHAEFYARIGGEPDPFRQVKTRWGYVTDGTTEPNHPDPARRLTFYLGTHRPHWLTFSPVPLFISAHTIAKWQTSGDRWPTRKADDKSGCWVYAIDSGGFTELRDHGEWRQSADEYGSMIVRFIDEIGVPPRFVAPQDWMCEPVVIAGGVFKGQRFVGTKLDVATHQQWTVENYLYLVENFPMVPWIPVLQGYTFDEYLRCVELYRTAGVDLTEVPLVGLGSVCRREATDEILEIVQTLYDMGLRMHGFGCKTGGLPLYGHLLESADSLAWSFGARPWSDKTPGIKLPECTHEGFCNNCIRYALRWREGVLDKLRTNRTLAAESRRRPLASRPVPSRPPTSRRRRRRTAPDTPTLTGLDELLANVLTRLEAQIQRELVDVFGPNILI